MKRRVATARGPDASQALAAEVESLVLTEGQIVVGPWLSELGFEVLYWIPFLRWLQQRFELAPERLVVVSRGGAGCWYDGIASRYIDLLDGFNQDEFRRHTEARWQAVGGQKQMAFGPFDQEALRRVGLDVGRRGRGVLHPSLMYRLFAAFWRGREPIGSALDRLVHQRLPAPHWPELSERLPDGDFFAVKFYSRPSFPDSAENRRLVHDVVRRLAERAPVALLETGLRLDEHHEFTAASGKPRHEIVYPLEGVPPQRNLEAQSVILSRARAFFGTYGGFSYLAPAYGVASFAYHSAPEHFLRSHLAVARRASARLDAALTLLDARRAPVIAVAGLGTA